MLSLARFVNRKVLHVNVLKYSTNASQLLITDDCANRIKEINTKANKPDRFLRVTVDSGGCSGFMYQFSLDTVINSDDRVFEKGDAKIVVDEISFGFVKGSVVDYKNELISSCFVIRNNPTAEKGCSCGASFSLRQT